MTKTPEYQKVKTTISFEDSCRSVSLQAIDASGVFDFVFDVIQKEKHESRVKIKRCLKRYGRYKVSSAKDRIRYLFNAATIRILFGEQFLEIFMSESDHTKNFVERLLNGKNLILTTVSDVPGTDYVSFLMFLKSILGGERRPIGSVFKQVNIVCVYREWASTISKMVGSLRQGETIGIQESDLVGKVRVVIGNPLRHCGKKEMKIAIGESDIILMTDIPCGEGDLQKRMQNFLSEMKEGAILFYISGSCLVSQVVESIEKISGEDFEERIPGKFLLDPVEYRISAEIDPNKENYQKYKKSGYSPQLTSRATFFVWQKIEEDTQPKTGNDDTAEPLLLIQSPYAPVPDKIPDIDAPDSAPKRPKPRSPAHFKPSKETYPFSGLGIELSEVVKDAVTYKPQSNFSTKGK